MAVTQAGYARRTIAERVSDLRVQEVVPRGLPQTANCGGVTQSLGGSRSSCIGISAIQKVRVSYAPVSVFCSLVSGEHRENVVSKAS
jgi:hypothetical protein